MKKLFVSAYACEPDLGSEIGVGWHWVLALSKRFELWVLTRKSNQPSIEGWLSAHPDYTIHFLYFDLPKWLRFWKKGLRGVRLYYNLWQIASNRIVKRTMLQNNINAFFHLTYGNAFWRTSSFGQKQTFIWGPIGGMETISSEYSRHYTLQSRLIESVRRCAVASSIFTHTFIRQCKNADLILCKTEITHNRIPLKYRDKAVLCTDVAADDTMKSTAEAHKNNKLELISVGRFDAWRGFDLAIEAMALAAKSCNDIHLTIVGDGRDKKRLVQLVEDYKLELFVSFAGKATMNRYKELLQSSDVLLNAALKEGAVTTVFDAISMGKPIICLNTTGYTRMLNSQCADIIDIADRETTIKSISEAILSLCNVEMLQRKSKAAKAISRDLTWAKRSEEFCSLIERYVAE